MGVTRWFLCLIEPLIEPRLEEARVLRIAKWNMAMDVDVDMDMYMKVYLEEARERRVAKRNVRGGARRRAAIVEEHTCVG